MFFGGGEIRLFVNPSVFGEFSSEINVLPSKPRIPPVKHTLQSLFITRRPLTNSNESLGDKWIWRTPCTPISFSAPSSPIAHPAPGPNFFLHFFPSVSKHSSAPLLTALPPVFSTLTLNHQFLSSSPTSFCQPLISPFCPWLNHLYS